jgi:hypothetical protein
MKGLLVTFRKKYLWLLLVLFLSLLSPSLVIGMDWYWAYQENPNSSSCLSCSDCGNCYDGDWGSYGCYNDENGATLFFNYTYPNINVTNTSLWRYKNTGSGGVANLSINRSGCWGHGYVSIRVQWDTNSNDDFNYSCYDDGVGWLYLSKDSDGGTLGFYEEGFWWNISNATNFRVVREASNNLLNISQADDISLSIIYSDDVDTYNISNNPYSLHVLGGYEMVKLDMTYGNTSYFRTIKPVYSPNTVFSFYMLDLNLDDGVEVIINLDDLTGDFDDAEAIIYRFINGSEVVITRQEFDLEGKVTLYLLKNALYTVDIRSASGDVRSLGNLIASHAQELTITLPEISFFPSDTVLGDDVLWNYSYTRNQSNGSICLYYFDKSGLTLNASFALKDVDTGVWVYDHTVSNTSTISFTYNINRTELNHTFISNFTLHHNSILGNNTLFEQRVFSPIYNLLGGLEKGLFPNIGVYKFWIALLFVFVLGLAFSARSSHIGMVLTLVVLLFFIQIDWISFGGATTFVFALFVVLAIMNFVSKSKREVGE